MQLNKRGTFNGDNDLALYRGIVIDNRDPKKLGRVKVRIQCFHGTKDTGIDDVAIPWAEVLYQGANFQSGSFIVPEVGSTVVVMFENGNHNTPIVFGTLYPLYKNSTDTSYESEKSYEGKGRLIPASQHFVDQPHREDISNRCIYQSPKGASVSVSDVDTRESVKISDANGMFVKLFSPIKKALSKDNKHKLKKGKTNLDDKAYIRVSTEMGQYSQIVTDGDKSWISIVDILSKIGLEIDTQKKVIRLFKQDSKKAQVVISDKGIALEMSNASVAINSLGDTVEIKAGKVKIESPSVEINGSSLNLSGRISVRGPMSSNSTITGNLVDTVNSAGAPSFSAPNVTIEDYEEVKLPDEESV